MCGKVLGFQVGIKAPYGYNPPIWIYKLINQLKRVGPFDRNYSFLTGYKGLDLGASLLHRTLPNQLILCMRI